MYSLIQNQGCDYVGKEKREFNSFIGVYIYNSASEALKVG